MQFSCYRSDKAAIQAQMDSWSRKVFANIRWLEGIICEGGSSRSCRYSAHEGVRTGSTLKGLK